MQYHVILLTVMVFLAPTVRATDLPKENTFVSVLPVVLITKVNTRYQLDCPGSGDMAFFLLHGVQDAFPVDYTDQELTVFANGSVIFKSIKIHHDGTHLCMRRHSDNSMFGHPVSVRVRPLPPDDLWSQVYRTQFITGLIAALVIFALFAVGCFVYKNQWRPKPTDNADEPIIRSDGYDNPVMNTVEDLEASNTKM